MRGDLSWALVPRKRRRKTVLFTASKAKKASIDLDKINLTLAPPLFFFLKTPTLDPSPPQTLQTTIMAAAFDGGVVLGADSRTSTGSYVANRATDKVTRLTERVYVCRSGSAADTQNISAAVAWHLEQMAVERGGKEAGVLAAARMLSRIAYQNKDALQAGLIVAGYDEADANASLEGGGGGASSGVGGGGGGVVYAVPLGGTMVRVPFAIGGSGSAYITGLCDKLWRPGMSAEECVAFVRRAVAHAIARDGSSGGCIRTVCITKDGAKREFVPGDQVPGTFGDLAAPVNDEGRGAGAVAAAAGGVPAVATA